MRKRTRALGWLTCLFAVAVVPLACSGSDSTGTPAAGGSTVRMTDNRFGPLEVRIAQGGTVHWVNDGPSSHTVTSDAGAFDSGVKAKGAAFDQTFATKGTFTYHCNIHPEMTGTVVVE
ncbi:MAG TPA: plastocyanin/azurin family copper-binding protein [Longimicrobiales bacterium]|nr:plastocyanin/azurin family copper-binding protein [Longimicrobiales bacterium]